jgi:sorbitol/mannitol transport system substrate-binding protein
MTFRSVFIMAVLYVLSFSVGAATELVGDRLHNGLMIQMQKLSKVFEQTNPGITVKRVILDDSELRQRVAKDIETNWGQFDGMTIGLYETPIGSKQSWLQEIRTDAGYHIDDLLPAMRRGLPVNRKMYGLPF